MQTPPGKRCHAMQPTHVPSIKPVTQHKCMPTVAAGSGHDSHSPVQRSYSCMLKRCRYLQRRRDRQGPSFTFEVIIVDDGSRDATARVAFDYVRRHGLDAVRVLKLPRNHGKACSAKALLLVCLMHGDLEGGGLQRPLWPSCALMGACWGTGPAHLHLLQPGICRLALSMLGAALWLGDFFWLHLLLLCKLPHCEAIACGHIMLSMSRAARRELKVEQAHWLHFFS